MTAKMPHNRQKAFKTIQNIISLAIPALMAISLLEFVNAEIYFYGPFSKQGYLFTFWNLFQMIPAFIWGYISDRNYRKEILIISQCFGLLGGAILYYFGAKAWVLILIALTFNPMPVARAALLDNFPHYSTLKLVAITFLAQNLPWVFFKQIGLFSLNTLALFTLLLLFVNVIMTKFLFNDRKDLIHPKVESSHSFLFRKNDNRILYTLSAFTLAELTFYLVWVFIEHSGNNFVWLDLTTLGALIGISSSMLYNRLPHMSIITLFYTIGFGIAIVAISTCMIPVFACDISLLNAMSHYSVVGGMYLPFVTEAVINMFGTRNKAIGSAMVELGDTIALISAPFIITLMDWSPRKILFLITFLYLLATILQKRAEKKRTIIFD